MNEDIRLGQAKNQATEILCSLGIDNETDFFKEYKPLVKRIYELNLEIDREILDKPKLEESKPKTETIKKQPTENQKYCPQCQKIIPKSWSSHRKPEGCGWNC